MRRFLPTLLVLALMAAASSQEAGLRTSFRVKYIADGVVYIDGGRGAGLTPGTRLEVKRPGKAAEGREAKYEQTIARLVVLSVASTSAVCEVAAPAGEIAVGDMVFLGADELAAIALKEGLSSTRSYPQVVTFTDGDPLDEEVREFVPRPPLPEINRARGRIGFDLGGLSGPGVSYAQLGFVFRADITRIHGTHWNLSGHWRGRAGFRSSPARQSVQDLINRTYHLALTYDNPASRYVAGVGRLYIPWATSMETVDGGYFGRRLSEKSTAGLFAGSTPDPTSWSYDPQRRIAGGFVNWEGGSYEAFRYFSTVGAGVSTQGWKFARTFVFLENTLSYQQRVSFFHAMQVDRPARLAPGISASAGLARSYMSLRVQATPKLALDLGHNYFRDIPTFDPQLVGTGLVDKLLFQGVSAGARYQFPKEITGYLSVGRNTRSGDARAAWNTMYGVTLGRVWRTGVRLDVRQSNFSSSFSQGWYRTLGVARSFDDRLRLELQAGKQRYSSAFSSDSGSKFVNTNADINLARNYFLQASFSGHRGPTQKYNQWSLTFGYRFDNRGKH